MISLSVYNRQGQEVDSLEVNEAVLGGYVRYPLLKQAIVMYHANKRTGTAATKGRSMVAGSGGKLFRQKGTGRARTGTIRTGKRVGGGVTFAKIARDFSKRMPKKQRRLATYSAVLSKLLDKQVVVVDELGFERARTKDFVAVLRNLKIDRSCLVALESHNETIYKSARNIPKIGVCSVAELNAGDICNHQKLLFTRKAISHFLNKESGDN